MFTGLVQTRAAVAAVRPGREKTRLVLDPGDWQPEGRPVHAGDSLAVSGVCLTVADVAAGGLAFDVIPETLRCTTLGALEEGHPVNLEPAVTPTQPLGGHFMQGHVDGLGRVVSVEAGDETRLTVEAPDSLRPHLLPKGSIAVDGVSLTIAEITETGFVVALIPETLSRTTLRDLDAGDRVNLEADMVVKAVVQAVQAMQALE